MKLHHILLVAFLTTITLDSVAQDKTVIDGYVKGADGKAADAYVTVSPKGKGIILGFADVDVASGYYKVEFAFDTDSVAVTAAGMAIGQNIKMVPNRSQRLDFLTVEQSITIKEVSIDLEVEASNLFNQQAYSQVNYSNLNIYRNVCQLRPMNVVAKLRFKLL